MCSNASITEILGINDKNLVILGNEKENIKGIEYTVLRGKLSYRPACCPKCGVVNKNYHFKLCSAIHLLLVEEGYELLDIWTGQELLFTMNLNAVA